MEVSEGIIYETAQHIFAELGDEIKTLKVERAVIGLFFTGVKLSNGEGGVCFTPVKDIPEAVCCPSSLRAMPNSGKIAGHKATEFIDRIYRGPLQTALGIAVMNALSETIWKKKTPSGYHFETDKDPVEEEMIKPGMNVTVIGALVPYIKMLIKRGEPFHILEKDARTLKPHEMEFFCPQEKADECIASSDLLIITGTTLINRTLDGILAGMKKGAKAVITGPTASMLPEAFYKRNVVSIGGIRVTKPDEMLNVLAEAGSGYHFYEKSARKLVIKAD